MGRPAIEAAVRGVLAERFGPEIERLPGEVPFAEVGLDSVDLLDALALIERHFGLSFEREELVGLATLAELLDLVEARLGEAPRG